MTEIQYVFYLLRRIGEALLIVAMAACVVHLAQQWGWIEPASHRWALKAWHAVANQISEHATFPRPGKWFRALEWWTYPLLVAPLVHVLLGPKQTRPIYLRKKGILYSYGGVDVDHNAGCRGGLILGATGAGKTQICINPRNHSILINNGGTEKPEWRGSEAQKEFDGLRREFLGDYKAIEAEITNLVAARAQIQAKLQPIQDEIISSLLVSIRKFNRDNLKATLTNAVFDGMPEFMKLRFGDSTLQITPQDIIALFAWARKAQRFNDVAGLPFVPGSLGEKLKAYSVIVGDDSRIDGEISRLYYLAQVKRADLQKLADTIKGIRFDVPPVGMLVLGAKGNEWQNVVPMLHHYGRDEDLCLLQTRPVGAPENWIPPAKFNLIGYDSFPADTFAKLLCDTSAAVTGETKQDFFTTQARDAIGNGIRLMRAIRDCQITRNIPEEQRFIPNLATLAEIMTGLESYKKWMIDLGAAPHEREVEEIVPGPNNTRSIQRVTKKIPPILHSDELLRARKKLEESYWNLPDETRGGVMGNIRNVISPFTEPEIAEVFCAESTFDIAELTSGKVICVAMPQLYAVQRMYVATIMKTLALQIGMNIFDLRRDNPLYKNRNVVLIDSDEHQVSAGQEDQQVDRTREAQFTLYAATQTRSALYMRYGGKEKATPVISNLRNAFICQAGNDDCAEESVKLIGEVTQPETSYSSGRGGSRNTSYKEKPLITKGALKVLPPFHVVWVPAEGKWIYRLLIVMPVTPDGQTPIWWFGTWNPWGWLADLLHLPKRLSIFGWFRLPLKPAVVLPPWRARAPARAQMRYLLGLDGTFITLKSLTRKKAVRMALKPKG